MAWCAVLDDASLLKDEDPVSQHERFERVVGDEQGRPGEIGQMALEFGLHVEAGAGVQG